MGNESPATSQLTELVGSVADKCQCLVDQAAVGFITKSQFLECIKDSGASANKAQDYVEQLSQCVQQHHRSDHLREHSPLHDPPSPEHESTPDGLEGEALVEF
jgi:hypothetical protein